MVKSGQPGILPIPYENSGRPGSELEVKRLSDILKHVPSKKLELLQRLEFHALVVYLSGRTTHSVDFESYACRRGTVVYVRPGQVQRWKMAPGLEAVVVVFQPTFLFVERPRVGSLSHERYFDDISWPSALRCEGADRTALLAWVALLESLYGSLDTSASSAALLRHVVSALLLDLARRRGLTASPGAIPPADLVRVRSFKLDLERSFRVTRAVGDYAQRLKVSPKTLDRACRAWSGSSAKSIIDDRVVLEAKRLLAHTGLTVTAVADDLGFSEATNFVKFFRARTGKLPGAFRARGA